jgi:quinol monooxygenase YgiN
MTKPGVYFIVDVTITEGKVDELRTIAESMTAGTQEEAGALAYEFYLDPAQRQCRLIEIYADSNAALLHCKGRVVQELVPKLLGVSTLTGFSVYGDLNAETAEILTQAGAQLYKTWSGFNRFQN